MFGRNADDDAESGCNEVVSRCAPRPGAPGSRKLLTRFTCGELPAPRDAAPRAPRRKHMLKEDKLRELHRK